jgi:hypothetical protein
MTVISSGKKHIVKKMTPNGHVALAWKPKAYPMTAQQRKLGEIARSCGIHKGTKPTTQNFQCIKAKFGHGGYKPISVASFA